MEQKSIYFLLSIFLFLTVACGGTNSEETIAQEFCQCFQKMTDIYRQLQAQANTGDDDQLIILMEELESVAAESEECVDQLENNYSSLLEEKEELIKAKMLENCPQTVKTLEEIDKGYE